MSKAPLFIDDTPSRTMTEIAATARRLKRREGLALIVIDYLQLIEPDNAKDPRQEQVAKIARRLKGLARELKLPVICLAQLNRQAEVTRDNRPRLSHLRESGAIEQDADVVMFVHRDEYYQTNDEDKARVAGQADIIVAKQRNGPVGDVKVSWQQDYTRFQDLARTLDRRIRLQLTSYACRFSVRNLLICCWELSDVKNALRPGFSRRWPLGTRRAGYSAAHRRHNSHQGSSLRRLPQRYADQRGVFSWHSISACQGMK